ncbi:MAG: hypothetical protein JXA30_14595 [Deltaproteobacteria bacterium]|nr:hypothetical protein [Deltaproteobacteria bacterium]
MKIEKNSTGNRATASQKLRSASLRGRLLIYLPLALLLAGPTPGAVGSCNQEGKDNPLLDLDGGLQSYCQEKEQLICWRRGLRDELDSGEVIECRREAIRLCEARYWSSDCRPTKRQADACLRALSAKETLQTEESELSECSQKALCTVKVMPAENDESDGGDEP